MLNMHCTYNNVSFFWACDALKDLNSITTILFQSADTIQIITLILASIYGAMILYIGYFK